MNKNDFTIEQVVRQERKFLDETRRAPVSNKNIILYYYYLKNHYSHLEDDNPCHSLFKDKAEENFFLNKDGWCSLEDYVNIVEKSIKITNNFELPKIVGSLLSHYQKEYKLQEFKEAAVQSIRGFLFGPLEIFRQISFFNYLFNKTKDMRLVSAKCCDSIVQTKFKPGVNPVFDYVSEKHIEGIFSSILDLFGMKNGTVSTPLKEYNLQLLIEEKFKGIKEKCSEQNNLFYLGDEAIAEKVSLTPQKLKDELLFMGEYENYRQGDENWAWLIKKNVFMEKKYLVLREGDIYNAPYFITLIKWEKDSTLELFSKFFTLTMNEFSPLGRGYVKLVQERFAKEQEETKLMAERQKQEKEFHKLLLKNYIHPRFINRAKIGLIPFKNIWVTNVFLDIHQSTQLRKMAGNEIFRKDRNILLKLIKKCLLEAAGEWGWLNKVMGDGCYVVFGAYNYFKDKQDMDHANEAIKFCLLLKAEIAQARKSGFLRECYVRFGIETGEVEIGEACESDIFEIDQEINLGTLRVFDTDGHSVNIAKRIEEASKLVIKLEKRENKGGIFIGPALQNFVKKNLDYKIREIDLSDFNVSIKDYKMKKLAEVLFE